MKLTICLQFYSEDRAQAMRLARLIADIEHEYRSDVKFAFVARFDCEHDGATVNYVREKFQVVTANSRTKWTDWPGGPNAIAKDILSGSVALSIDGPLLMLEPDCVPVYRDWINIIVTEWLVGEGGGKWIVGAWRNSGPFECGHINGCCVVRGDIARRVDLGVINEHLAWDCAIAPQIKDHWTISPRFLNHFQSTGATDIILREHPMAAIVHGYKDNSMYDLAIKRIFAPREAA